MADVRLYRPAVVAALLGCVLLPQAAPAELPTATAARLELRLPEPQPQSPRPVRLLLEPSGGQRAAEAAPIDVETVAPGNIVVQLTRGVLWKISAEAPGLWASEEYLLARAPTEEVSLKLWRTGVLKGRLAVDERETLPEGLTARFRVPSGSPERPLSDPAGELRCKVLGSSWTCEVPAGRLDLRLRAPGFISHYRWGFALGAGESKQLGTLRLRRGSSVVGWVETAEGPAAGGRAKVELRPRISADAAVDTEELEQLALSVNVNERGHFHLEGAPPGDYDLVALQKGFAPARRPVTVLADLEAELRDVIVLDRPQTLEISIEPALDPWHEPWDLQLFEVAADSGRLELLFEEPATPNGWWTGGGLAVGRFRLSIRDSQGGLWQTEEFELVPNPEPFMIQLQVLAVRGSIRLGEEGLPAKLRFSLDRQALELESDEEGFFTGYLTGEGRWAVAVEAKQPPVRRLLKVDVEKLPGKSEARIEIEIPDTVVRGEVVDEAGEPVTPALVKAASGSLVQAPVMQYVDDEGRFELRGLEPGTLFLSARAPDDMNSGARPLVLQEDLDPPPVQLVVRRTSTVRGQVVSPRGSVPGAAVDVIHPESSLFGYTTVVTDAAGRFEAQLPAAAKEMLLRVYPPGFALRALRLPVTSSPVIVAVDQLGGSLSLDFPWAVDPGDWEEPRPVVFKDGTFWDVQPLRKWAAFNGRDGTESRRLEIPHLEAGHYQVCNLSPQDAIRFLVRGASSISSAACVSGYLAPLSELELEVPAIRRQ